MVVYALDDHDETLFPNPAEAEPDGLLAVGGGLTERRLIHAYLHGIFPWYSAGQPVLWWSPDPRCLLFPAEFHQPKSLRKLLRKKVFSCSFDKAFVQVIENCSQYRPEGTWLVDEMKEAYSRLHLLGLAHSVEVWHEGELVGGLYGVSLGRAFFGESMFYRMPDASKVALTCLVDFAISQQFLFIDCQQETDNLLRFGARSVPRAIFLELLGQALAYPTLQHPWTALQAYLTGTENGVNDTENGIAGTPGNGAVGATGDDITGATRNGTAGDAGRGATNNTDKTTGNN